MTELEPFYGPYEIGELSTKQAQQLAEKAKQERKRKWLTAKLSRPAERQRVSGRLKRYGHQCSQLF
ncbi:MAG: hypothetical protein ACTSV6_04930 [Candidatus Heimdallarchaeota archaeon]